MKKCNQNITRNTEVKNSLAIARVDEGRDSEEKGFQEVV